MQLRTWARVSTLAALALFTACATHPHASPATATPANAARRGDSRALPSARAALERVLTVIDNQRSKSGALELTAFQASSASKPGESARTLVSFDIFAGGSDAVEATRIIESVLAEFGQTEQLSAMSFKRSSEVRGGVKAIGVKLTWLADPDADRAVGAAPDSELGSKLRSIADQAGLGPVELSSSSPRVRAKGTTDESMKVHPADQQRAASLASLRDAWKRIEAIDAASTLTEISLKRAEDAATERWDWHCTVTRCYGS